MMFEPYTLALESQTNALRSWDLPLCCSIGFFLLSLSRSVPSLPLVAFLWVEKKAQQSQLGAVSGKTVSKIP